MFRCKSLQGRLRAGKTDRAQCFCSFLCFNYSFSWIWQIIHFVCKQNISFYSCLLFLKMSISKLICMLQNFIIKFRPLRVTRICLKLCYKIEPLLICDYLYILLGFYKLNIRMILPNLRDHLHHYPLCLLLIFIYLLYLLFLLFLLLH